MPKGTCCTEATSNSEKIKPVSSAVIELYLSEGIGQSGSQSVENSTNKKFNSNSLEAFLNALLGLVIPNQYCEGAMKIL